MVGFFVSGAERTLSNTRVNEAVSEVRQPVSQSGNKFFRWSAN
jgi:hypothetical protein